MREWRDVAGVPVHYDRGSPAEYGTRGRPAVFRTTPAFHNRLTRCFTEVWEVFGRAEVITSAGAWVPRPGKHGQGRAFDLDAVFWAGGRELVTLRDGWQARDRQLYLGVEALLRRHFGIVLDYNYNAAHRDHFHLDDGAPIQFRTGSRSTVLFVQAALVELWDARLDVDGLWGPLTGGAVKRALAAAGVAGTLSQRATWLRWLSEVARRGLSR